MQPRSTASHADAIQDVYEKINDESLHELRDPFDILPLFNLVTALDSMRSRL